MFSTDELDYFDQCINKISDELKDNLMQGIDIDPPYSAEAKNEEKNHYEDCIASWSAGFIEGFFHNEEAWFLKGAEIAAELLLPIMSLSGLFESNEFQEIRSNDKLMCQFEEIIPEQLVDIFLFYHTD